MKDAGAILRKNTFRKRFMRGLSRWQLLVLLAPAVIYLFIFNYIPIYGVQIAFRNYKASKGIWGSSWVGFKHFIKFFNLPTFGTLLKNTLTITLYSLLMFPLPIIFALMINEVDNMPFKKTVQMISYAPHFISMVVLCSMITLFLNEDKGVINHIVAALGGTRVAYMEKPYAFPSIVVWSGEWQGLGWGAIIYFAALSNISPELIEAAKIDGANRLQIVLHVNIPTILPTIIIMLILRCGRLLSLGFEKIYLLQNPLNLDASQIISTYVYEIGLRGGQFSLSSAIGLFNNVVNVLALLLVNGIARKVSDTSLW